jgi:4-diphosphocytidyl-2-C-methyl-D-erythritol kinase
VSSEAAKFELAPAKVNLFLHVGETRPDGYHELESLVAFAHIGDVLRIEPAEELSLSLAGPFAGKLDDCDNLVLKAARALAQASGVRKGARMVLYKVLPVASGIGGGSSDAAAALRGLADLWDIDFTDDSLREIGATIGSDVPVCVARAPSWMAGRGEKVTVLDGVAVPPMVLVNPGVAVPTGEVFRALKARRGVGTPRPGPGGTDDLLEYLKTTANDLEAPARKIAPAVGEVLDALSASQGVRLSRMSGSGATCFALFENAADALAAVDAIEAARPEWWAVAG